MADYLAMLQGIRELFSISPLRPRTYFSQVLDSDAVPGIDAIYPAFPAGVLGKLLDGYNHRDRTKRLLDYLLALYGESFRDDFFSAYKPTPDAPQADPAIEGRLSCLGDINGLTRDRAAGADAYLPASAENLSGLEAKLNRLLGFSVTSTIRIRVIEHILLRPLLTDIHEGIPPEFYPLQVTVLFPVDRCRDDEFALFSCTRSAEEALDAGCPAHIQATPRWLPADRISAFDKLHEPWWILRQCLLEMGPEDAKSWRWRRAKSSPAAERVDAAALKLIHFLRALTERES
jgi:hypothetical protein